MAKKAVSYLKYVHKTFRLFNQCLTSEIAFLVLCDVVMDAVVRATMIIGWLCAGVAVVEGPHLATTCPSFVPHLSVIW